MGQRTDSQGLGRKVGLFSATFLVIANMIGTGVFTTSGFVMGQLGSSTLLMWAWVVGGAFALTGALCYAELGTMFPRSGGDYVFLRESFGGNTAFFSGWISLIVGFPAPVAAAAIAFVGYTFGASGWAASEWASVIVFGRTVLSITPVTVIACLVVILFTIVHTRDIGFSKRVQNTLTAFKFILILAFIVAGLASGNGDYGNFHALAESFTVSAGGVATALVFVSFAYSGWNAAAYIGGEIRRPERNLPAALLLGTLLVTMLYLLVNAVYVYAMAPAEMTGIVEVGAKAAVALFGSSFGSFFSIAVALGLLSVISAMTLAGPRVYYAMAKEGDFFDYFGHVDERKKSPRRAVLLQCGVSLGMILTTAFDTLLVYIGVLLSLSSIMTVVGMIRLRRKRPELSRPYKCFAYPLTPVVFIAGNFIVAGFSLWARPIVVIYALLTLGVGAFVAIMARRARDKRSTNTQIETSAEVSTSPSRCLLAERS